MMDRWYSRRSRTGFTLPEVLITILLISILFTLGMLFSFGLRSTKRLKGTEIAHTLAAQAIEVLRAAPFDSIDDDDPIGENSVETDLNKDSGPKDQLVPEHQAGVVKYKRKVEVKPLENANDTKGPRAPLKVVNVTVEWTTPEGVPEEPYYLTTTVANLR